MTTTHREHGPRRAPDLSGRLRALAEALDLVVREDSHLLRAIDGALALRPPHSLSPSDLDAIEGLRRDLAAPVVEPRTLLTLSEALSANRPHFDRCALWLGDITRLGTDAIVNAANSELLGCRTPNHHCVDNAIHTAAGPRLRDACARLMANQARPEAVGGAKITPAFALPSRFVVHTVGPQLARGSSPTPSQRRELADCYRSCLTAAAANPAIRTLAFCAISTGVFAFPGDEAAAIATTTVFDWLDQDPLRFDRIVFNVFSAADRAIYEEELSWRTN